MTSRSWVEDIDDEFCKCPICRQIFHKPKYLPCLHRYCSLCLKLLIGGHQGLLQCPECDEEFTVPWRGVDGFKTDCLTGNIIQYITLLSSLESNQRRECYGCSTLSKVTAYCFRCDDFLCEGCKGNHLANKCFQEHKSQTLPMACKTSRKPSLAQVFAAMELTTWSCYNREKPVSLCNEKCKMNLLFCSYFGQTGNTVCVQKVTEHADEWRKILSEQFDILAEYQDNIQELQVRVKRTKEMLKSNVGKLKDNLQSNYDKEVKKRKERVEKSKEQDLLRKSSATESHTPREKQRERENIACSSNDVSKIDEELQILCKEYEMLSISLEIQKNENYGKILEISKHAQNSMKRFQHFKVIAKTILSSNSNWIFGHCIYPTILQASSSLIEKMRKDFPKLETLSHVTFRDRTTQCVYRSMEVEVPTVSATSTYIGPSDAVLPVSSEHVRVYGSNDRYKEKVVIITERQSTDPQALIRLFQEGKFVSGIKLKDFIKQRHRYYNGPYNCDLVTSDKIVILFPPNVLTIYNVSDISNITTIRKQISCKGKKAPDPYFKCFSIDHVNNNIYLVDNETRHVHVLNENLEQLHTLVLPLPVYVEDMIFKGDYLIICDRHCEAYAFFFRGLEGILMFQFMKPQKISIHSARSVCTDKRGFIYILWNSNCELSKGYISQYSQCGQHLLKTTVIDGTSFRLRIRETELGEQFLVWSVQNKIYSHDLEYM